MDDNLNVVGFITVEKRIESLETAVKQKTAINDSLLELIYANSRRLDTLETQTKDLQIAFRKILEFMEAYTHEKDA
jgi:chromosome segregation ATPase